MKKHIIFNIISFIVLLSCIFFITRSLYNIYKLNIIPSHYLKIAFIIIALVIIFIMYITLFKKNILIKLFGLISMFSLIYGSLYINSYTSNINTFLTNTQSDYDYLKYSVIVLKKDNYKELNDLKYKSISFLEDDYNIEIKNSLNSFVFYEDISPNLSYLVDNLLEGEVDAVCLEENYLSLANEEIPNFNDLISVIYTFEIKTDTYKEVDSNIDINMDPFILYISGIDQYGNTRGRSDVNQLVVVNPITNHILLVNTPRDYYVQLDGTTGLKDKLTHAGIYGVEKSIKTLENLYDIDINHYIKVNFDTLINLVDAIDGIDVESDSSFKCHTNNDVYVLKGLNHFNGVQALAYSRERYAYLTGDHHRGFNQQQVIAAIIDKITATNLLNNKYNSLFKLLNSYFQTDIDVPTITSFIKYQINRMPEWHIDNYLVTGDNSMNYTYSMGTKYLLYVMEPDYDSVNQAKIRINEVLNER